MKQIRSICNGYVYAIIARDANNRLYTHNGNVFTLDGSVILLSKKEIQSSFKYKLKTVVKIQKFYNIEKIKLETIILRITSKYFKKLYTLSYKNGHVYIKDKYDHDLLLHKALKYTR